MGKNLSSEIETGSQNNGWDLSHFPKNKPVHARKKSGAILAAPGSFSDSRGARVGSHQSSILHDSPSMISIAIWGRNQNKERRKNKDMHCVWVGKEWLAFPVRALVYSLQAICFGGKPAEAGTPAQREGRMPRQAPRSATWKCCQRTRQALTKPPFA
jgi:hypothetical protein